MHISKQAPRAMPRVRPPRVPTPPAPGTVPLGAGADGWLQQALQAPDLISADAYARAEAIVSRWSLDLVNVILQVLVDRLDAAEDTDTDACSTEDPVDGPDTFTDGRPGEADDAEHSLGWGAGAGQCGGLQGAPEGDDDADAEEDDHSGSAGDDDDPNFPGPFARAEPAILTRGGGVLTVPLDRLQFVPLVSSSGDDLLRLHGEARA